MEKRKEKSTHVYEWKYCYVIEDEWIFSVWVNWKYECHYIGSCWTLEWAKLIVIWFDAWFELNY